MFFSFMVTLSDCVTFLQREMEKMNDFMVLSIQGIN